MDSGIRNLMLLRIGLDILVSHFESIAGFAIDQLGSVFMRDNQVPEEDPYEMGPIAREIQALSRTIGDLVDRFPNEP